MGIRRGRMWGGMSVPEEVNGIWEGLEARKGMGYLANSMTDRKVGVRMMRNVES